MRRVATRLRWPREIRTRSPPQCMTNTMINSLRKRLESANPVYSAVAGSLILLAGLVYLLARGNSGGSAAAGSHELIVYCAAGMRAPVEQIATQYEQQFDASVRLQFGGSNTLLNQIELNKAFTA